MAEINQNSSLDDATLRLIDAIPGSNTCYGCSTASLRKGSGDEVIAGVFEEVATMPITAESLEEGRENLKPTPGTLLPLRQRFVANCLLKRTQGHCPSYQGGPNA